MKIVVQTQYMENYGYSEGRDHWKSKGGSTYVIPNLNWTEIEANKELAKKFCDMIAYRNPASEEYVLGWSFEEDDAVCWDEWEADNIPHFTRNDDGTWNKVIEMEGRYNWGITKGHKEWHLDAKGEVTTYNAKWFHKDYGWFAESDIPAGLRAEAA